MAKCGATLAGGVYLRFLLGLLPLLLLVVVPADTDCDVGGVPPLPLPPGLGLDDLFGDPPSADFDDLPKFKRSVVPPPPLPPPVGTLEGERDGDFVPEAVDPLGEWGRGGEGGIIIN